MAEYIEREATLRELESLGITKNMKAHRKINTIPAADVVEVRHGEWVICSDGYYPYCSICKAEPKNGVMSNYCPNCGAKMNGKEGVGNEHEKTQNW